MKDQLHHHRIVYPQVRHWMMLARSRVAARSLRLRRRRAKVRTGLGALDEPGKGDSGQRHRKRHLAKVLEFGDPSRRG
jgi:hypothetical protein